MISFSICPAVPEDAESVSRLIRSVAHHFSIHPGLGAPEQFLGALTPGAIRRHITSPRHNYLVGLCGRDLCGVVAIRDCRHLLHFFVAPAFQKCGLGRKLWEAAKSTAMAFGNYEGFTVNATLFAVPVYERFGFRATGPRVEANGIAFVPMHLARTSHENFSA
jgi:GNAT superfamily N-acetyltransferase